MAAALGFALIGCGGASSSAARLNRTSVLPFENLSGDPSLDKLRQPLQRAFHSMSGARALARVKEEALLIGASVLAQGVIERIPATNQIQLTLEFYDAATHKLLHSATATDSEPFGAVTKLAKLIEPKATGLGNVSPQGVSLWTDVLNSTRLDEFADRCQKLLESEPGFGQGYVSCVNAPLTSSDREAAAERGYAHWKKFRAEEQMAVGQVLLDSGKFQQALEVSTAVAPDLPLAWNTVGYAQAILGNLSESKRALDQYRKFGGDEPNAVDSLGEAHYFAGKYAEAEKYFLEAGDKFPQTPQGRTAKMKAACMRALQGNREGAQELARSAVFTAKDQELWRSIILEQDPKAMCEKIEASRIIRRPGRSN